MVGEEVKAGWIVKFSKDKPHFEARQVKDLEISFQGFIAALQLWKIMQIEVDDMYYPPFVLSSETEALKLELQGEVSTARKGENVPKIEANVDASKGKKPTDSHAESKIRKHIVQVKTAAKAGPVKQKITQDSHTVDKLNTKPNQAQLKVKPKKQDETLPGRISLNVKSKKSEQISNAEGKAKIVNSTKQLVK